MSLIYVVDDNDAMREGMSVALKRNDDEVYAFRTALECLAAYKKKRANLVVTDFKMDGMDGFELLKNLREFDDEAVVIVVTAFSSVDIAVEAMKKGAIDFITKPFTHEVLRAKADAGLALSQLRGELVRLRAHHEVIKDDTGRKKGTQILGDSEPVQKMLAQVKKVAATEATVFIHGESGTGKELVARMIHENSPRRNGPFVVTHCAALAETLLESELFGHEKGSFTGALKRKLGRFELADGGTLFLDEIGEISPSVQTKLLRVLQEKELQRVGGEETVKVDVRIITATHRDLKKQVEDGHFRQDLFFRLHIIPLELPALRERNEDIALLANAFLKKQAVRMNSRASSFSEAALRKLTAYAWPGNVRELENAIEQAAIFATTDVVQVEDLPNFLQAQAATAPSEGALPQLKGDKPLPELLEEIEKSLIERALQKANGVKTETARLLGIKTSALYYKLEKYGLVDRLSGPVADA